MAISDTDFPPANCVFDIIIAYLMPFYLAGAKGDAKLAQLTILAFLKAYRASTPAEIELAGHIVGFNAAAADSLRQSMRHGLSDTLVLRYRNNAIALNRSAERCQAALEALQERLRAAQPPAAEPLPDPAQAVPPPETKYRATKSAPFAAMSQELQALQAAAAAALRQRPAEDAGDNRRT